MPCLLKKSSNAFEMYSPPLSDLRTFTTCSDCLSTKVFHSLNLANTSFLNLSTYTQILLGNERKKQRDQRRKQEHNTQWLHTMERVISSSPYAFIYMCRLGPAVTTHMGQCHRCNLTLPSNTPTLRGGIVLQPHYFT